MADPRENQDKQILTNPENWDEMKKKYQEREEEQLKKVMESREVGSVDELKALANKAIANRSQRTSRDHEKIKSHNILVEPKSQDIKSLRQQLNAEIDSLYRQTMVELSKMKISPKALKGRVSIGGVAAEAELQPAGAGASPSSPSNF